MAVTAITAGTPSVKSRDAKQFQHLFEVIPFTVALTDATLPAATSSEVDVTVPGAALGDYVLLSIPADTASAIWQGKVSAADTVTITYHNSDDAAANTALSTGPVANGIVLKLRSALAGL